MTIQVSDLEWEEKYNTLHNQYLERVDYINKIKEIVNDYKEIEMCQVGKDLIQELKEVFSI